MKATEALATLAGGRVLVTYDDANLLGDDTDACELDEIKVANDSPVKQWVAIYGRTGTLWHARQLQPGASAEWKPTPKVLTVGDVTRVVIGTNTRGVSSRRLERRR